LFSGGFHKWLYCLWNSTFVPLFLVCECIGTAAAYKESFMHLVLLQKLNSDIYFWDFLREFSSISYSHCARTKMADLTLQILSPHTDPCLISIFCYNVIWSQISLMGFHLQVVDIPFPFPRASFPCFCCTCRQCTITSLISCHLVSHFY
jgi:hypothetical protein